MRKIEVHQHDKDWGTQFSIEAEQLKKVFGKSLLNIYHVGSTSVPELIAKPTIDILCVVKKDTPIKTYNTAMENLGYQARGECLEATVPGTPGRFYFPKVIKTQHLFHVHVCRQSHEQIHEMLAFRDYLRAKKNKVIEYGLLKTQLAASISHDNIAYMQGKDAYVKKLITEALEWSATRP